MTQEQQKVKQWMANFGQETHDIPTQVDISVLRLRAKLILEEVFELLTQGFGLTVFVSVPEVELPLMINEDHVNSKSLDFAFLQAKPLNMEMTADGLGDAHVVGYTGTGAALGIDMEPVMDSIILSNNSKMWTEEEVKTRDKEKYPYAEIRNIPGDRKFIVTNHDGKIMKSPSYSPADIKSVLEKQKVHQG